MVVLMNLIWICPVIVRFVLLFPDARSIHLSIIVSLSIESSPSLKRQSRKMKKKKKRKKSKVSNAVSLLSLSERPKIYKIAFPRVPMRFSPEFVGHSVWRVKAKL